MPVDGKAGVDGALEVTGGGVHGTTLGDMRTAGVLGANPGVDGALMAFELTAHGMRTAGVLGANLGIDGALVAFELAADGALLALELAAGSQLAVNRAFLPTLCAEEELLRFFFAATESPEDSLALEEAFDKLLVPDDSPALDEAFDVLVSVLVASGSLDFLSTVRLT